MQSAIGRGKDLLHNRRRLYQSSLWHRQKAKVDVNPKFVFSFSFSLIDIGSPFRTLGTPPSKFDKTLLHPIFEEGASSFVFRAQGSVFKFCGGPQSLF